AIGPRPTARPPCRRRTGISRSASTSCAGSPRSRASSRPLRKGEVVLEPAVGSLSVVSETVAEKRARIRAGIPKDPDLSQPPPKRLLTNWLFWVGIALLITYVVLLVLLYRQTVPDREVPGGRLIGIGTEAWGIATRYALLTAIPLSLIFFL